MEGAKAIAAVLKDAQLSTLRCATQSRAIPADTCTCQAPLNTCPLLRRSVGFNNIMGEAADTLAKMVLEHPAMTDFCGIPLASLHENSVMELNLERKGIGGFEAIVLSKLLPSAAALTSLKCAAAPSRVCQPPMNTSDMPPLGQLLAGSAATTSAWRAPRRSPPCSRTLSCLRWGALLPQIYTRPVRVTPR